MNALKAFVVMFYILFSTIASAVTVRVVPGQGVGLADPGYLWAGIVKLNIDGNEYWAASDFITTSIYDPTWYNDPTPREMVFYTRSDILAGAPVVFAQSRSQYDIAAQIFLYGLLGASTQDNPWGASFDEMIWKTMWSNTPWHYAERESEPGTTFVDMYNGLLPSLSQNYNFDGIVWVVVDPQNPDREFLVKMVATPVPPAIWLFVSGILALVAVGRRKIVRI